MMRIGVIVAFGFYGIWYLINAVRGIRIADASLAWPTAPGRVLGLEEGVYTTGPALRFGVRVRYRYTVEGVSYESTRPNSSGFLIDIASTRIDERYPTGKVVEVAYNPDDPAFAVLEAGRSVSINNDIVSGVLFVVLSIVIAVITV